MKKREYKFTIGDRVVKFNVDEFNENVDLDKLLKIDYSNIWAEILTFPVIVNKLGLMAVEMDNLVQQSQLDLKIFEARKKKFLRKKLRKQLGRRPIKDEVNDAYLLLKSYKEKMDEHYKVINTKEIVYSAFLSAKDKSYKLDKLSLTLKKGDFDERIIQKQFNNLYFTLKHGRIKNEE